MASGKFFDQVASREPQSIVRDYAILLKKVQNTDKEQNRFFMKYDFDTGNELPSTILKMQNDMLPSLDTPNIKVRYEIVTSIFHDSVLSTKQNLPSLFIPISIAVDPKGPIDSGNEYSAIREQQ